MNPTRHFLICLLALALGHSLYSKAEDIDIYSTTGGANQTPNVLIILDNAANFEANTSDTPCTINGVPNSLSNNGSQTAGGVEQCALYNVVQSLPVNTDNSARLNIGVMVYNANNISDISGTHCGGANATGGCLVQPLTPMDAAHKGDFLNWIASWKTSASGVGAYIKANSEANGSVMQEAWAYYAGRQGISGRNYSGVKPAAGCQKNFVIFIGNAYNNNGSPSDANNTASSALTSAYTAAQLTQPSIITNTLNTVCGAFTFPSSNHETGGYYADEWSRFMTQFDLYSATGEPESTQSILTYTIGLHGAGCQASYAALLKNMADYGHGSYFATSDYASMVSALMQILNQIQAVNSVFASSTLPVSVNAQGTYLNQIYMGMFRPDASARPRWVGNLKQYAFYLDINNKLHLGDSLKMAALNPTTGFVDPDAISYWTCSRSDNPYLAALNPATKLNTLTSQGQICTTDPSGGFWSRTSAMTNTAGGRYDLADGELVEKGGAAQQARLANLTNDYTTAAGSSTNPRKLYTFCPSEVAANCQPSLSHADNAFATSNTTLSTAGIFGNINTVIISSISRNSTIVTVNTASSHGLAVGNNFRIYNAVPNDYNVSSKTVATAPSSTQFTFDLGYEYPPVTATGSYYTFITIPKTVTQLNRTLGSMVVTATATSHGFTNGESVAISGSSEPQYNGTFTVSNVTANTFQYTLNSLNETPSTSASGGTAKKGSGANQVTANILTVSRPLGGTTVTVTTNGDHGLGTGTVRNIDLTGITDSTGASSLYNGTRDITVTDNTHFTFTYPSGARTDPAISPTLVTTNAIRAVSVTNATRINIVTLTRSGNSATATTASDHNFALGSQVIINGTPGANEGGYIGTFAVSATPPNARTFQYTLTTYPITPATPAVGANMAVEGGTLANSALINWVRGHDNNGDETGPGGSVTIRPSLHGDVLHSRPTVINYGGKQISITATSDSGTTRTATASTTDVAKIGAVGASAKFRFANAQICTVTVKTSTTFQYPSINCGDPGAQTAATTSSNTIVYYGDNGGVFHAVNGNQANPLGSSNMPAPGGELWGFIPKEHFTKLNRQRTNTPQLKLSTTPGGILPTPQPKDYFVDGPVGVYQNINLNGTTEKAIIYLSMRRGGRVIYALDVTDPLTPKLLWEVDNQYLWKVGADGTVTQIASGMGELGQTWSQPKAAKVAANGGKWVLIFGAGYDIYEDYDPPTLADTMGRGIFVLDAFTGDLIWKATYGASSACSGNSTLASCTVAGMDYSIPADITLLNRDYDANGYIDRLYAADTGGNIWRVDLETYDGNGTLHTTPDYWRVHKLAALGCSDGPCSIPPGTRAPRKFFYPPEVIATNNGYDAVIAGTGDREHPLYVDPDDTRTNQVVLLKDTYQGKDAVGMTAITNNNLFTMAKNQNNSQCLDNPYKGYRYKLKAGEKVVNAPLVTAGAVNFGTNTPANPSSNSCLSTLGTAEGYELSPFKCEVPVSVVFTGGGLPPSPVSGVVTIQKEDGTEVQAAFVIGAGNQGCVGDQCGGSALEGQKPVINVPTSRIRTYWYLKDK